MKFAVFSIRPKYVKAIIDGRKTYELRRKKPNLNTGDQVIIYQTTPDKNIAAIAEIDIVIENYIEALWEEVKDKCAVTHEAFVYYFEGCITGCALKLKNVKVLDHPPTLADLRLVVPDYTPPQFFHYLNEDHPLHSYLINMI